jgi:hypothetical protein
MDVKITASKSRDGKKIWYGLEWGRGPGQRQRTGIYTWAKAWTPEERKFNQEQLRLLKALQANTLLKLGAQKIGVAPRTIQKNNFFEYYEEYVRFNQRPGNRHLSNSLIHFKEFVKKEYQKEELKSSEIDEKMCLRFREYLLKRFKGETPANYFARFKKVVASAYKDGYFDKNLTDEIASKANPRKPKDILESEEEFLALINTPCKDIEVKRAYTFSLYTGMSWVDVYNLTYDKIKGDSLSYQRGKTQQYGVELYDLKAMAVRLNDDEYQVDGTRIRPTSRLRLRDWSVRLTRDAAGAIIDVDILDHLGNSRSLKRKGTVKKQETTVQSTAPSPAPQPAAQRAEAQQPEASAKPWLNRDSEKWEEAIKFVQGGGDVNKILAKYRLSKANEEELKKYSTTKNAV